MNVGIVGVFLIVIPATHSIAPQSVAPAPNRVAINAASIMRIVDTMRHTMSGKGFLVTQLPEQQSTWREQFVAGQAGRPLFLGHFDRSDETGAMDYYTQSPAHSCAGAPLDGELIIRYVWNEAAKEWRPSGSRALEDGESDIDDYADVFNADYLTGELASLQGRPTYRFVAPSFVDRHADIIPGVSPPKEAQELWIDAEKMLPVRWEILDESFTPNHWGYVFNVDSFPIPIPLTNVSSSCVPPARR